MKYLRVLIAIIITYGGAFLLHTCISYGPPNWWSSLTVLLSVIGIIIAWYWTFEKWNNYD